MAVLWTAFVVYGLSSEPSGIPRFPWLAVPGVDKLIHFILFAVEALSIAIAFSAFKGLKYISMILGWCFFLGGATELIQHYWVEGRTGDFIDLLADTLGSVIGLLISSWFLKK